MQKVRRRAAAGLCAVALIFALAGFPVRARAAATAAAVGLTAVGFAVTVAAFLNAAGIYPFSDGSVAEDITFTDWSDNDLSALISQYNATGPNIPLTPQEIKAFLSGATLCVTHNAWVALRAFVLWVKDNFNISDNMTDVVLSLDDGSDVFVFPSGVSVTHNYVISNGTPLYDTYDSSGNHLGTLQYVASGPVKVCILGSADNVQALLYFALSGSTVPYSAYATDPSSLYGGNNFSANRYTLTVNGVSYVGYCRVGRPSGGASWRPCADYPVYATLEAAQIDFAVTAGDIDIDSFASDFALDTSAVSIPAALPEGAEFGGLQVAGLGEGATAQAVQDVIEGGVMERQQPAVVPVEVQVQQGLEVDAETGAVTESPIVITPTDIPLVARDYAIPSLSGVFPFSIPWDIARVWQALDAEPRNPLDDFTLTLDIPWLFGDSPPVVAFGLSAFPEGVGQKMNDVISMVRAFLLVIACVAYLIWIAKFIRF